MRSLAPLVLLNLGCSSVAADDDARIFGEDLGRFSVTSELEESSCGPGALGTPERWTFDIQLSREEYALFWNQGGAAVEGAIDADRVTFALESVTQVPVVLSEAEPATCVMRRLDRASGQLDDPGYDVTGFSGALDYRFTVEPGADCAALVGVAGGFEGLPCEIHFAISAERTLAPRDRY